MNITLVMDSIYQSKSDEKAPLTLELVLWINAARNYGSLRLARPQQSPSIGCVDAGELAAVVNSRHG